MPLPRASPKYLNKYLLIIKANWLIPTLITSFYVQNDYDPVFVMDHIFNGDVDLISNYFEKAGQHGLDPTDV
jgi:hypothetical protein